MNRHNRIKYLPKSFILIQLFYLLFAAYLFGTVIYDSFVLALPFYYILFYIFGRLLGLVFNYTQIFKWNETDKKVLKVQDKTALTIFILFFLFRLFVLPSAVEWTIHPHHLSDALFLMSLGVFYSRTKVLTRQMNELVWQELSSLRNKIEKTGKKGNNPDE